MSERVDIRDHIHNAVQILREGGIVIFPTDTAFGIGCRMDSIESIDRLFNIRKRPVSQATPVLVAGPEMAKRYVTDLPETVDRCMHTYWPGALTIIYHCNPGLVYSLVRGGGNTIGLRMPNHEVPLSLVKNIGVPLLGPSANFHGLPTPYTFESLDPSLVALVDYVIPGVCSVGLASTVVDFTYIPYKVVRQGSVYLSDITI